MEELEQESLFGLELNDDAIEHLRETAKWARFLSILGIIACALMVIGGLLMAFILTSAVPIGGIAMFFLYIIFAAVYMIPVYFLLKFGWTMKNALDNVDSLQLSESFGFLKSTFKFMGILAIIMLCFYGIFFVLGGLGSLL